MSEYPHIIAHTDGGSRGNPGPSAWGYVLLTPDRKKIEAAGGYLGVTTNNVAEYTAIYEALKRAVELGAERVEMYMDSELAVKQLTGLYKVKNPALAVLNLRIHNEKVGLKKVTFTHVRREYNAAADAEVNKVLDEREG